MDDIQQGSGKGKINQWKGYDNNSYLNHCPMLWKYAMDVSIHPVYTDICHENSLQMTITDFQ